MFLLCCPLDDEACGKMFWRLKVGDFLIQYTTFNPFKLLVCATFVLRSWKSLGEDSVSITVGVYISRVKKRVLS